MCLRIHSGKRLRLIERYRVAPGGPEESDEQADRRDDPADVEEAVRMTTQFDPGLVEQVERAECQEDTQFGRPNLEQGGKIPRA